MNNQNKNKVKINENKKQLNQKVNQKKEIIPNKICLKNNQEKKKVIPSKNQQQQVKQEETKNQIEQKVVNNNQAKAQEEESFLTIDTLDQKEEKEQINILQAEDQKIENNKAIEEEKQIENNKKVQEEQEKQVNSLIYKDPEAQRVFKIIEETKRTCTETIDKVSKTLQDLQITRQNITDVDQRMKQFMDDYAVALNRITDNLAITLENQNMAQMSFENDTKEYFDSTEEFSEKINDFVNLIKTSKHIICFTGAGISTFAGIPDYRSTKETVLPTGAGVHTRDQSSKKEEFKPNLLPKPSLTHMAIRALQQKNIIKAVISQNIDGLHLKSGIPLDQLMELHGNLQVQCCNKCGKQFFKDQKIKFYFPKDHKSGKKCYYQNCDGELLDNIINFGEALDKKCIEKAIDQTKNADLCIALGSSLGVSPANSIVSMIKNHGKVVIVNLQKTQLDHTSDIRFFSYCDQVMKALLEKLKIPLPPFEQVSKKIQFINFQKMSIQMKKQNDEIFIAQLNENQEEIHYINSILIKDLETKNEMNLQKIPYKFTINNKKKVLIIISLDSEYGFNYILFNNSKAPQNFSINLNLNEIKFEKPYIVNFLYNETKKEWKQLK